MEEVTGVPVLVWVSAFGVGLSLPLLGWAVLAGRAGGAGSARANLLRGIDVAIPFGMQGPRLPQAQPGLAALVQRVSTAATVARLERRLAIAGRPPAWPLERLLIAKLVLAVGAITLGVLFVLTGPGVTRMLVTAVVALVAWALPDLLLVSQGQKRQETIGLELPDTLDQMTIAVQAGLGFEAAMARTAHNGTGPLAEELTRTLQDIQLGQSRRASYLALAERTTVSDLRRFLRAVIQADAYGVALSGVLKVQAAEMRLKRRMRAEEKAMQIPVKVIFPLILCILPTLFIVLLGPAVMDIMSAFSG